MRRLARWLVAGGTIALLILFARTIDWRAAWIAIRGASPALLAAATVVNLASLTAHAVAWWVFLRAAGAPSLGVALRATVAGAAANNLLLANAGEAVRVVLVTRASGVRSSAVLAALAIVRLVHIAAYLLLMAGALVFLPMPEPLRRHRTGAVIALAVLVAAIGAMIARAPGAPGGAAAPEPPGGLAARARTYAARTAGSLFAVTTRARVAAALGLELVNWGTQLATYHLAARAAHFPIDVAGSLAALLVVNVGFLVRITPGNVGVFQAAYALTATMLGLPVPQAVAVALLLQTLQVVPITLLGAAVAPDMVLGRGRPAAEVAAAEYDGPPA